MLIVYVQKWNFSTIIIVCHYHYMDFPRYCFCSRWVKYLPLSLKHTLCPPNCSFQCSACSAQNYHASNDVRIDHKMYFPPHRSNYCSHSRVPLYNYVFVFSFSFSLRSVGNVDGASLCPIRQPLRPLTRLSQQLRRRRSWPRDACRWRFVLTQGVSFRGSLFPFPPVLAEWLRTLFQWLIAIVY